VNAAHIQVALSLLSHSLLQQKHYSYLSQLIIIHLFYSIHLSRLHNYISCMPTRCAILILFSSCCSFCISLARNAYKNLEANFFSCFILNFFIMTLTPTVRLHTSSLILNLRFDIPQNDISWSYSFFHTKVQVATTNQWWSKLVVANFAHTD